MAEELRTDLPPPPAGTDFTGAGMPEEVRVGADGASLTLNWKSGRRTSFTAQYLRENSQSAGSRKIRLSGLHVPAPDDVRITAVRPIGAYAVNIVFSDGYDRGIFPWIFLQELAARNETGPAVGALTPEDFLKSN